MPDTPELPPTVERLMLIVEDFAGGKHDFRARVELRREIREYAARLAAAPQTPAAAQSIVRLDEQYRKALAIAIEAGRASVSLVQRKLAIRYSEAQELIALMVRDGYVGVGDTPGLPAEMLAHPPAPDAAPAASSPEAADERANAPAPEGAGWWQVSYNGGESWADWLRQPDPERDAGLATAKVRYVPATAKSRFIWTCVNGCGECGVKRIEFEFSREETLDGRLISGATEPRLVSACCGAELVMWDDEKDEEVMLQAQAAPKAALASAPAGAGEGAQPVIQESLRFYERHLTESMASLAGFLPGTEDGRKRWTADKLREVRAALAGEPAVAAAKDDQQEGGA